MLAIKNNIKTIAFPTISTGVCHFPKKKATEIAITEVE
jgi:O-acetyl-ADP-ribose deacetylase (regulator of RNase III)